MQDENDLTQLVQAWAQGHLRQRPAQIFLVESNPLRMLQADPPERVWIAELRLPGGTTATLLLGQRHGATRWSKQQQVLNHQDPLAEHCECASRPGENGCQASRSQ